MHLPSSSRLADERGLTLSELMVAIAILSVALGLVYSILTSVQRGVERQIDRSNRNTTARQITYAIDREVRSALGMSTADSGMTLTLYTATNYTTREGSEPACVQIAIDDEGRLLKRWWPTDFAVGDVYPFSLIAEGITSTSGVFAVDPDGNYDDSVVVVDMLVNPEGNEADLHVEQTLHGDNVSGGVENLCDEADEQPDSE